MILGFAQNRVIYNFEQKQEKKLQLNVRHKNNLSSFFFLLKRFLNKDTCNPLTLLLNTHNGTKSAKIL